RENGTLRVERQRSGLRGRGGGRAAVLGRRRWGGSGGGGGGRSRGRKRSSRLMQEHERVHGNTLPPDLEEEVRPGTPSRVADPPKDLAHIDALAPPHQDLGEVGVGRFESLPVLDDDDPPIPPQPADESHDPRARGADRRAVLAGDVDAGMELAGAEDRMNPLPEAP